MSLSTYLHLSCRGLFASINANAESRTYALSSYTYSLTPGHFSGPYTPPPSPVQKKKGQGEGQMEKQKPNRKKKTGKWYLF